MEREMSSNFKEQAIEYVKQAVHEDYAGNYAKALPLYMSALEYFKTHLKYEKNPKVKEVIDQKLTEYLRRAEVIRAFLEGGGPGPGSNGDAAVTTGPKTEPEDGEGGDGEDPEQAKLRPINQQPGFDDPSNQFDSAKILDEIGKLNPAVLDEIRKLDPAVLLEIRKFDPAVIDDLRGLCLKENKQGEEEEAEADGSSSSSSSNGPETEPQKGKEESGGDGESSRTRHEQRQRRRQRQQQEYPPGECWSYVKTGTCNNGAHCKFNHPPKGSKNNNNKHYNKSGTRKHGKASGFNHSRGEPSVAPILQLNFLGLPIRPGKKECQYYMQNASCMNGKDCKFNHPDPTAAGESDPPSGYGNGGPASSQGASSSAAAPWSTPRSLNDAPFYSPLLTPPYQGFPSQNTEWNGYQAPDYLPERSMPAPQPYVVNKSVTETNVNEQHSQHKQVEELLEQPRKPVCINFARRGDSKFKSNCKRDHRKNKTAVSPSCAINDKGLLRPAPEYLPERSMPAPPPYVVNKSVIETSVNEQHPQHKQVEELLEQPAKPVCINFARTGDRKVKSNCKPDHRKKKTAVSPSCALNDKGLPLRPAREYLPERSMPAPPPYVVNKSVIEISVNEQHPQHKQVEELLEEPVKPVCTNFARTGDRKFKSNCKPDHRKNKTAASPSCAINDKGLPFRPVPEHLPERSMPAPPPYVVEKSVIETSVNEKHPQHKKVEETLEQPGKPVCINFARTGDRKFKSNFKHGHRKNNTAASTSCAIIDKGLPSRPGENICTQYICSGICNSGRACKFDHPPLPTFTL